MRALTHQVQVAKEGGWVRPVNGNHALLKGDALGPGIGRDATQGIALSNRDRTRCARVGHRCFGRRRNGGISLGRRAPGRRCRSGRTRRLSRCGRDRRRCNRCLSIGAGARIPHLGRIEQHGVFTNQLAGCPVQLEQEIDKGLVDRLVGVDFDKGPTRPLLDRKAQTTERRVVLQTGLPEGVGRCQTGGQGL